MSSVEGVSSDMNASVVHTKVFFVTSSEDWVDMRSLTKGLWSRHEVAGQIQTFTIQHGVSMEKLCVRYLHHGWRDESSQNENTKAFLGWLVESCDGPMIGFDAKCGQSAVRLIQLSTATRCLILRLPSDAEKHDYLESGRRIFSSDVRAFFEDGSMMKAGSDVWRSGVKLWSDTEGAINGALNIARAKAFTGELPSLEEMCEMFCGNGSFYQDAASVHSDWDRDELTLRQLVAAALDAQANYVVTAKLSPNQWPAPISLSLKPATSESKENSSANSQTRLRTEETDRKIVNAGVTQSASASSVPPPSVSYTPQHGESMTQTSNVSSSNPPPLPALSSSNAATASSSQASWSSVVNHAVATAHPPPSTRPSSSAANAVSVTPSKSHPTDPSISEPYLIHLLQGCLGDSGYRIFLLGNHFTHKTGRFWRTLSGGVSLKDFILQHVDDGYFKVEEVGHKDGMLVKNGRLVRFESMPPPVDSLLAAPSKSVDSSFSAKYSKHPANTPFSDLTLIRLLRDIVGKAGVYYFDIGSYFRDSHHGLTWKTASGEQGLKNFILAYAQKGYFAIEQSDHPNPQNCIVKQGSKEPSESDFDTLHDGSTTSTSTSAPSSFSYSNGIVSHISERIPTNSTSSSSTSLPSNPRSTSSSASSARRAPLSDACLIYLLHQCLDENGCSVCDFGGTFTKASRGHYWRTVAANESLHKFVMRHVSEGYFSVEDRGPPHGIFVKKGRPVRLTHADHAALASLSSSATSASITESGLIATLHSALGEQGRYICNLGPAFTNFNSGRPWSTVAPNGEALKPFIMRHIQDGYFTFTDDGDLRGIFVKKGPAQPVSSSSSLSSSSSSFSHKTQPPHTSAPTSDSELIRLLQSAIPIEGEHMFRLVNQSHS